VVLWKIECTDITSYFSFLMVLIYILATLAAHAVSGVDVSHVLEKEQQIWKPRSRKLK
jgi:hypothetical protein